jgi:hypothetical protein
MSWGASHQVYKPLCAPATPEAIKAAVGYSTIGDLQHTGEEEKAVAAAADGCSCGEGEGEGEKCAGVESRPAEAGLLTGPDQNDESKQPELMQQTSLFFLKLHPQCGATPLNHAANWPHVDCADVQQVDAWNAEGRYSGTRAASVQGCAQYISPANPTIPDVLNAVLAARKSYKALILIPTDIWSYVGIGDITSYYDVLSYFENSIYIVPSPGKTVFVSCFQ